MLLIIVFLFRILLLFNQLYIAEFVLNKLVKLNSVRDVDWGREMMWRWARFSYKLRYIVGFGLVEMAISTNPKRTIYRTW